MTIELSEYVIDAIADAVVKKIQEPKTDTWSIKEVVDALEKYGLLEQEPCGDCISRQAVLEQINCWRIGISEYMPTNAIDYLNKRIKDLQTVNPQEPKTGHWIEVIDEFDTFRGEKTWHYECSVCGETNFGWDKYKYCSNCGAKMESEEAE